MVNVKGQEPVSRGIPSKRALWFEYDNLPMPVSARWEIEDILKVIFPPHLQRAQYELAVKLVKFLASNDDVDGNRLAGWQAENNIPNSTLRNLVIPKLVRIGMIARERKNPTGQESKDKKHHMILRLSLRFGEAFKHVGSEWNSLVETWRVKRRQN